MIPSSTSSDTYEYIYDYATNSWVENIRSGATTVASIDSGIQVIYINDAIGTINAAVGTINSATTTSVDVPKMFYGYNDGNIGYENTTTLTDRSTAFTTSIRSKIYSHPDSNLLVRRISFKYLPKRAGTLTFKFSRDAGQTWEDYETVTIAAGDIGTRKRKLLTKHINTQEFCWRIDMESANVELLEYYVDAVVSPLAKTT